MIKAQDVEHTFQLKVVLKLFQYRAKPLFAFFLKHYIHLLRKSPRWWFQCAFVIATLSLLGYWTVMLCAATFQNQQLNHLGHLKLSELDAALGIAECPKDLQVVAAQRGVLSHIELAKAKHERFNFVKRLGVNVQRSQVCPFSARLLSTLDTIFVQPTQNELEANLIALCNRWEIENDENKRKLYPVYVEKLKAYEAMNLNPSDVDLARLAHYWSLKFTPSSLKEACMTEADLKALLTYYFHSQRQKPNLNGRLIVSAEKQLNNFKY